MDGMASSCGNSAGLALISSSICGGSSASQPTAPDNRGIIALQQRQRCLAAKNNCASQPAVAVPGKRG